LVKFLDLLLWNPVLILVLGILGFVEKGAVPLVRQLGRRWLFLSIPWSYELSITSRSSELVSPNDYLVSSIWFLLFTGQVVIGT
jgi:hypothetical protein